MKKATDKKFQNVVVLKWEFSHYTSNGNGVLNFTIQTEAGEVISGKTLPGLHQAIGRSVAKLASVTIRETAAGKIKMIEADR